MTKLFGTDGIRGTPGKYPLTIEMIANIAKATALFARKSKARAKVVIGKDTRLSGSHIEENLAKTFSSYGEDVLLVGIITTPGLSFMVKEFKADMGIMISASHNKATDNGLKFFNSKGHKLSIKEEEAIEELVHKLTKSPCLAGRQASHPALPAGRQATNSPKRKGNMRSVKNIASKYSKFLLSTVKGLDLKGVRIALDCASGSASSFAQQIFKRLNAKVYCINNKPQGENINVGGALNPQLLKDLVIKTRSDIGVAVDGDGDRGILVDEKGNILDGDFIIAIMADYLRKKEKLPKNSVVTTVMSNYGLKAYLDNIGITAILTQVGDKHVLEALLEHDLNLGGEQSGHVIFLDYLATPDGLLTALQLLKVMKETKSKLSQLSSCMTKFPQILVNVKVRERRPLEEISSLNKKMKHFNKKLDGQGRILLRYSGTEPLARVMVEGKDEGLISDIANSLADEIRQEIGIEG